MTIRTTLIAATVGLSIASTAFAGGPVIIEEAYEAEPTPARENNWIVPVVIGLLVIGAIASNGGNDAPAKPDDPQPCKFTGEGGC